MMEHYRVQTLLVRAVTALCALAASGSDDVRSELTDEAAWGLQVWMDAPPAERSVKLRAWCDDAVALVSRMPSSERAFLQAQLALLRLRAFLPAPAPLPSQPSKLKPHNSSLPKEHANGVHVPRPAVGANQRKLLAAVRSSGPIRSRDLITLLAGQLSDRTVKRSLKDLAIAGLVRRTDGDNGVVYEVVGENA